MGRITRKDEAFKRRVAAEFRRALDRALAKGFSVEDFARKLGVTRAALHKYLHQESVPSLRVLDRARKYWGVRLTYGDLGDRYIKPGKKDDGQMDFQFSLEDVSSEQIEVKRFSPKGPNSAELVIQIHFSKTA
jgi:transcriptional regulator with XRE-family HTH domain